MPEFVSLDVGKCLMDFLSKPFFFSAIQQTSEKKNSNKKCYDRKHLVSVQTADSIFFPGSNGEKDK